MLEALNKKLLENYSFTIDAANAKERSVNVGVLNTFRSTGHRSAIRLPKHDQSIRQKRTRFVDLSRRQ
jgi:hypothetical protein